MSYHDKRHSETLDLIRAGNLDNTTECFLCGNHIHTWFVYWMGSTGGIALHEGCANRLGWDFIKDAAILRLKTRNGRQKREKSCDIQTVRQKLGTELDITAGICLAQ